ncbi:hypothetical protein SBOR_4074 [Sclerotinia borealis F-4128]|uniref:BZIP domain-containing protein n=1 Tax=Sclerotinia borealis (strain F-4128) TaxID=1432307 RepID=W9CLY7_SCLBF|nr:hypothetical protein SBOR_4074 [Sclerotinia borealis F-4128]
MSTVAEKANLARIRDNQRRSRARRKEYLQEIEARLRQCELQGIEASSEIQMAARRVADENKKLRSLLAQQGVGNDIVESYLQMSPEELMISGQYGSESTSVQQLEHLLQTRKMCCGDGSIGPPSTATMGQIIQSRESSCSGNTAHSLWDPVHSLRSLSVGQAQISAVKGSSSAQQFMIPRRSSAASRHSSISQTQGSARNAQNQQQQRFNMTSIALPNTQHSTSSSLSIQTPPIYDFDPQFLTNQSYNTISPQTPHMHPHLQAHTNSVPIPNPHSSISSHQTSPPMSSTYATTMSSDGGGNNNNMNSCVFATDIITTMAGADPAVIRAELGCVPGMDCNVDNQLVFNVMDRYTGSGVGL